MRYAGRIFTPNQAPRVSVIVPVYNAARWIERTIQGLLTQDFDATQYELLLVDNNSSDDSKTRIRQYPFGRSPNVRLLEEPVQSSYAARNRGVAESCGELLLFTDADCVPAPDWLAAAESALQNPSTQVALGSREPAGASLTAKLLSAYDDARIQYILDNRRERSYFAFTNNMAVRRSAFLRYGPFETVARGADTMFLRRLIASEGPASAEWAAAMRVRHMEFNSAFVYFKKNFLYARAQKKNRVLGQCENLSSEERWHIFRKVIEGRPARAKAALALALFAGRFGWTAGSLL